MEPVRAEITGNAVLLLQYAKFHTLFLFPCDNSTAKVQF